MGMQIIGTDGYMRPIPAWDHGDMDGLSDDDHPQYLLADGSRGLSADWDIGAGRRIEAEQIRARSSAGLRLYNDGGVGITILDNGRVGIGTSPSFPFHFTTSSNAPQAYFTSTGASTRLGVNHTSNAGVGLYTANLLRFSIATYQAGTGNYDFTFYNDQLFKAAMFIDGSTNYIGINTDAPAIPLHVVNDEGGGGFWDKSSVAASAQTILPASTVADRALIRACAESTDGAVSFEIDGGVTIGNTADFNSGSGDTITFDATSGALTVARTAGTKSWNLSGYVIWL